VLQRACESIPQEADKEKTMATTFYIDSRGLPPSFNADKQKEWKAKVNSELTKSFGLPEAGNENMYAAIKGMLLLDEQFAPESFGFQDAIQKAWKESLGKTKKKDGKTDVPNREIYAKVAATIPTLNGGVDKIALQQFASVSRYVIAGADDVPIDHNDFAANVRLGLDKYVAGAPAFDSLTLPALTGEDGADVEIEPDNVKAVALIYAAYQLERLRLFHVVDRMTELFVNGMLPIGFDAAGKALDTYYWDSEDRLSETARQMQYGRCLGVSGADVSREVQPNKEFDTLFLRFLSSIAEYDRQRRVADILDNKGRALRLTGEQVRKNGRDLAANASLYGWGGTHFAARRLNSHITTAFDIVKLAQIQKAYGVSNPWQVVERVAANEWGQAPNIVKYRTMAESGKAILDIVAKHTKAWNGNTGKPLFDEPLAAGVIKGDIPPEDEQQLLIHTQYWLAVNGVQDEQVDKMSQPAETVYAPSMPAFGAVSPNLNGAGGGGNGAMEKLRQMVASGTAPTLEQLQQMLPAFKA
jgi:hypothetical protein